MFGQDRPETSATGSCSSFAPSHQCTSRAAGWKMPASYDRLPVRPACVSGRRPQAYAAHLDNRKSTRKLINDILLAKQLYHQRQHCGTTRAGRRIDDRDPMILVGRIIKHIAKVLILREKDELVGLSKGG